MKRTTSMIVMLLLVFAGCAKAVEGEPKKDIEPTTEDDKTFYALGLFLSQNLGRFNLTEGELEMVKAGLTDGVLGKSQKVALETYGPKINDMAKARGDAAKTKNRDAGKAYLDKIAKEEGVKTTGTGLLYKVTAEGAGAGPTTSDTVKVNYRGTLIDGTEFDSSYKRGEPAVFPLGGVIACWQEGLQFLKPGAKATLYCPPDIAYGDNQTGQIPPGSTLVFDVELIEIVKP